MQKQKKKLVDVGVEHALLDAKSARAKYFLHVPVKYSARARTYIVRN